MNGNHEWKLVAPWYRWQRQFDADGVKPWQTRPVFQKFDQNDFVKIFTNDPQRSLKFLPIDDTVFNTSLKLVDKVAAGPLAGRFTRLYAPKGPKGEDPVEAHEALMVPTGVLKLYLPTHKRFYLVVCELHCYVAGFPMVTSDQVCQSGFVVRRRVTNIPPANLKTAKKEFDKIQAALNAINADIGFWMETAPATGRKAKQRTLAIQKAKADGTFTTKLKDLELKAAQQQEKLTNWRKSFGVTSRLEGWIPEFIDQAGAPTKQPLENVGSWRQVEETPQQSKDEDFPRDEAFFPLFALFPDPNIPKHSARGRNIYFGVVPTTSLDTDQFGAARFDSDATYEIRCFVRHHKAGCPRLEKTPDCHGPLVWSEPTEIYKLAGATDLLGTANRPITIRMPDFSELAAQAAALPANKLAPVRVEKPQSMNFQIDDDGNPTGGGIGGFQICFFSIPLITIIAMFLLQLFLPIVVFLFGLFFLLALKFCIPPSLSVAGGLSAKLDVLMPKLELDASIDVDVEFDAALGLGFTIGELHADFQEGITEEHNILDNDAKDQLDDFSNTALLPIGEKIHEAKLLVGDDGKPKAEAGVDVTASVEYEPRVEVKVK
jgi:hypothetical protein